MTQLVSPFQMYVPSGVVLEPFDGLDGHEHETKRQMQAKMAKEVNFAVYAVPCKLDVHTSLTLPPKVTTNNFTTHHSTAGLLMGKRRGVTFATDNGQCI